MITAIIWPAFVAFINTTAMACMGGAPGLSGDEAKGGALMSAVLAAAAAILATIAVNW